MPLLTGNDRVFVSAEQVGLATNTTVNIAHGFVDGNGDAVTPDHVEVRQTQTSTVVGADSNLCITADGTNLIIFNAGSAISGTWIASGFIYTSKNLG